MADTIFYSPHMRKVYGDSLRKEAGLTKTIRNVAVKNARMIESRAGRHAPDLRRVAQEVRGTFEKVFEETAEVVEDFLAKCLYLLQPRCSILLTPCRSRSASNDL
jgi:phosphatidylethanolamine N-methyltransferase